MEFNTIFNIFDSSDNRFLILFYVDMEDNALELLKEEMETEEIHLKVNVIHRMKTVILAIGVEDTIKKLIPYLERNLFHQFFEYFVYSPY